MPVEEIVERAAPAEEWLAENCSREEFIRSRNEILDEVVSPMNTAESQIQL